ncbi:NAD(P)H-dependent oxidoreductase [Paenarthrobacter sp. NPDC090520]|uniref:NAD(P)H-dependent oxidoreductase n=1 Tax=Paenarthrobacter sp. NPDC090520 TaxID=3364382 RepID=UPI0038269CAC
MHVLIVLTHPAPESLTASIAREIAGRVSAHHTVEVADLSAEGFAPAFSKEDLSAYRLESPLPADVQREQERVGRADAIVFVYPIYWWGIPALLKGWIERVFSIGWAWGQGLEEDARGLALVGKKIHLVGLGASSLERYEKRGFLDAMHTSVNEGTFGYCSAPVTSSRIIHGSEGDVIDASEFVESAVGDILQSLESQDFEPAGVC